MRSIPSTPSGAHRSSMSVLMYPDLVEELLDNADELEDLVVGNGSASELRGNNATYTATITPAASGTVTVNIAAGAAQDGAGNPSAAADHRQAALGMERDGLAPGDSAAPAPAGSGGGWLLTSAGGGRAVRPRESYVRTRRRLSDAGGGARGPPRSTGAGCQQPGVVVEIRWWSASRRRCGFRSRRPGRAHTRAPVRVSFALAGSAPNCR